MDVKQVFQSQKEYFLTHETLSYEFRKKMLIKLKDSIKRNEALLLEALKKDLNKSSQEAYMTEIGLVYEEISHSLKHLKRWMKRDVVSTCLAAFPSRSYIYKEPYGVTMIMSPWNYPFLLTIQPLVGAIEGGNTCMIRPSSQTKNVTEVIEKIINEEFDSKYLCCVKGGRDVADILLDLDFDLIFFTGSPNIGKKVLAHAANNLTPCVLELGGKSPCIVTKSCDLRIAARRILFGKAVNAGQTCVAPDYLLIDESIKDDFIKLFKEEIKIQFNGEFIENEEFPKIINEKNVLRLKELIEAEKDHLILGGKCSETKVELTLVDATFSSKVMEDEIFGPILPVITFSSIDEVINEVNARPTPLALYIYSSDKKEINRVFEQVRFGAGCANDCLMHLSNNALPFGGLKQSGMGQYHGKKSFDTFTHDKGILDHKTYLDLSIRYHPYSNKKEKMIRKVVK